MIQYEMVLTPLQKNSNSTLYKAHCPTLLQYLLVHTANCAILAKYCLIKNQVYVSVSMLLVLIIVVSISHCGLSYLYLLF